MAINIVTAILFLLEIQTHGVEWEIALFGNGYEGEKIEASRRRSHYIIESFTGTQLRLQRVQEQSSVFLLDYEGEQTLVAITELLAAHLRSEALQLLSSDEYPASLDAVFSLEDDTATKNTKDTTNTTQKSETELPRQGSVFSSSNSSQSGGGSNAIALRVSTIGNALAVSFEGLHVIMARVQ